MADREGTYFHQLRVANVNRCVTSFKHAINDWSPGEWACATAGELGEACNLIKKLKRGEKITRQQIAFELADTVIYLDLLAAALGINLGKAVKQKFNIVSRRVKSKFRL